MRWPLKYQISVPMAVVMLLGVAAASGLNAYLAARHTRTRIEDQFRDVAAIVTATKFPLTPSVLQQLQGLSGADFVLADPTGNALASSRSGLLLPDRLPSPPAADARDLTLVDPIHVRGESYFHARVPVRPATGAAAGGELHILYPLAEYEAAWQTAVFPSLGVLIFALPAVVLLAVATSARISHRIGKLQGQLRRIAGGDFRPVPLPRRNDELRDLAEGVNRSAGMLASYEATVRQSERMHTLAQLGGALAHQLRNSVTGCRMALDLHTEDCPLRQDESLRVARRQLGLMEQYVRRFLQLGKAEGSVQFEQVDIVGVIGDVLPLVEPAARHARVALRWQPPASPIVVWADVMELSQLLINLLLNAIEAAGLPAIRNGSASEVRVEVDRPRPSHARLCVSDSGPGPGPDVRDRLFEPFVSEKPDGVGLGLWVVRTIARQHGARLSWDHKHGWTHFRVEFPLEVNGGRATCR